MIHRHLQYPSGTTVENLPSAAIVDILERGDLDEWKQIGVAIAREPSGRLAESVVRLIDAYPMYGTSPLWRAWIDRCRARSEGSARASRPIDLATLRRSRHMTQADLADRLGMSQSDLSKLEHRRDTRLSTLRAYLKVVGGRLLIEVGGERLDIRMRDDRD